MANFCSYPEEGAISEITLPNSMETNRSVTVGLWGFKDFDGNELRILSSPYVSVRKGNVKGLVRLYELSSYHPGQWKLEAITNGGDTWAELTVNVRSRAEFTIEKLRTIMPGATPAMVHRYFGHLARLMPAYGINTGLRMAHFLAQLGHESADLNAAEEFSSGQQYERRADLGNTHPGDGPRFKGRGLIQLTGRSNYAAYGRARGQDFLTGTNNLLLATDPELAVDVSCFFWNSRSLNALADKDNLNGITHRINGGFNGLVDRSAHLVRAKRVLVS